MGKHSNRPNDAEKERRNLVNQGAEHLSDAVVDARNEYGHVITRWVEHMVALKGYSLEEACVQVYRDFKEALIETEYFSKGVELALEDEDTVFEEDLD